MNREIARLLAEAGVTEPFDWKDIVIRQNYAMVPTPSGAGDLAAMNVGFNLNVLSHGSPIYFAKCRDAGDPELQRSTAIRNCLAGERDDGLSVSPAGIASSGRMTVQVSRFIPGSNLGEVVLGLTIPEYLGMLRTVLFGNAALSRLVMSEPGLLEARPATLSLSAIASRVVDDAAQLAALDHGEHSALTAALLAAGDVPSRPQHGDLWWANLLASGGRIWLLDFDSYGEIRVPLFDDLTFMLGTLGVRGGSLADAVEWLGSEEAEARDCRALLLERAEADGLTVQQIDGVIVYYLAHMAFDVHRRAGAVYGAPHVAAFRFAAQRLASGRRLHPAP
jgi:hypothetical protein